MFSWHRARKIHEAGGVPSLDWEGETELRIGDVKFHLSFDSKELRDGASDADRFLLGKSREMVEKAWEIALDRPVRKIFEMGILHGGSVVLYDLIFRPERIVAVDHSSGRVQPLDSYIRRCNKSNTVKPYYGVSQDDREKLGYLLDGEFPKRDIDLIIDDASHLYPQTRDAFNICFPYLGEGGLYIIEDWGWAHWPGDVWQKDHPYFAGKPALSNLLIELFMLSASRPDLISELLIDHNAIVVRRGSGSLPKTPFRISDHYLLRGRTFSPVL